MDKTKGEKYKVGVTWRAILIALILIPINAYWVFYTEIVRYEGHPTTISIFYNSIFIIFCLVLINGRIHRRFPGRELRQGELLTIYIMLNIGSALVGHDAVQVLVPIMCYPFKYATPENQWNSLFVEHLPKFLTVRDKLAIDRFFQGASSLYDPANFRPWVGPVLWWCAFIFAMIFVMLCMTVVLRKQWTEHERLTYPLVHLPLDMTAQNTPLWRNRLLWIGFGIAAFIDIVNGLHGMFPNVPVFPIKLEDQSRLFTTRPWNAIGWFPVDFYPFAIGLGMLLPLDLSFSCWFFFWIWKLERIGAAWVGWDTIPQFPYVNQQSFGAYMGIFFFALMMSRRHVINVVRGFFGKQYMDDKGEPIGYRTACTGIILGTAFLLWFSFRAIGFRYVFAHPLVIGLMLAFWGLFFALIIAITRMRAELGPPAHDLHDAGPDRIITSVVGPKAVGVQTMSVFSMFFWFNRAYRCQTMPFELEGFKIAERTGMSYRRLFAAMTFTIAFGVLVAFWTVLHLTYKYGAAAKMQYTIPLIFGSEPYNRLQGWLTSVVDVRGQTLGAVLFGFGLTLALNSLRMRLMWFPFHPVGYAVSSSWSMHRLWIGMFIAWMIKGVLLRYGGLRLYRQALPFFLGLILGECVVGSLWTIFGITFGVPTYAFWP